MRNTSIINLELRFKMQNVSDVQQDMLKLSSKEAEKSTQQIPRSLPTSPASQKKSNRYSAIFFHGKDLQSLASVLSYHLELVLSQICNTHGFIFVSQTIIFVLIFLIFFWGCLPLSQAKNSWTAATECGYASHPPTTLSLPSAVCVTYEKLWARTGKEICLWTIFLCYF